MHHQYQLNKLKNMTLSSLKAIAISCCVFFMTEIHAQRFEIQTLKAQAEWTFGGNNKMIFESHHLRVIARYDSFVPALRNLFEDCRTSNLNFDSFPSPLQMHYVLFKDGKRKSTSELRVSGLELGTYFKTEKSASTLFMLSKYIGNLAIFASTQEYTGAKTVSQAYLH